MKSIPAILSLTASFALASLSTGYAGLVFTIELPGVQSTTVAGATTESFDAVPLGAIGGGGYASAGVDGTYSGGQIINANVFGGAGGGGRYDVIGLGASTTQTLQFNAGKTYFGMWWSAGDARNQIEFFDAGNTLLGSFVIGDIIPFLSPAYFGNPNGGGNPAEAYAYLNFTTTAGDLIDHISINQIGGLGGFESDNHSTFDQPIAPPGGSIPEPGTALFGLALTALATVRRRR